MINFKTAQDFINNFSGNVSVNTITYFSGFASELDGTPVTCIKLGTTGVASQTPLELGSNLLSDTAGNLWRVTQSNPNTVDTLADIRALEPHLFNQSCKVLGHTLVGSGGGDFYFDAADTTSADNNASVVVTAGGKRWKRIKPDRFSPEMAGLVAASDFGAVVNSTLAISKHVYLPENEFNTTTPIVLNEHDHIVGYGYSIPSNAYTGGTLIKNAAGTSTFIIDGEWQGFDARRFIQLSDFAVNSTGNSFATINSDFLTLFEIESLYLRGNSDYHIYFINSYNGSIRGGRYQEATVANLAIVTAPLAADSVFSGQMLFEDIDFWGAVNVTNNAAGTLINAIANLIEQMVFIKCHWQANDIGLWIVKGGDKTITGCHFEANLQHDLRVEAGSLNPKLLSANVNNGVTTLSSFYLNGYNGLISNVNFLNVNNGASCIHVGPDCKGLEISNINISRAGGADMLGILVEGQDITIGNITARTLGGENATWPLITLETGAKNIYIKNLSYIDFGGAGAVVDNGAENVVFEDATIIESKEFVLDGGSKEDAYIRGIEGFINRVWMVYTSPAGAGVATIYVGRSVSAGTEDLTRYVSALTTSGADKYTSEKLTVKTESFISSTDALIIKCLGDSVASGTVKVFVEITPYRALT